MNKQTLDAYANILENVINNKKKEILSINLCENVDVEEILNSVWLTIKSNFSQLSLAINLAESKLDVLVFEEAELQTECERLRNQIGQFVTKQEEDMAAKENDLKQHRSMLKKVKLSLYERVTMTKIAMNDNNATAFIFDPKGLVQRELPINLTQIDSQSATSPLPCDSEVDKLWRNLDVSDEWRDLFDESSLAKTRPVLTSIDNVDVEAV